MDIIYFILIVLSSCISAYYIARLWTGFRDSSSYIVWATSWFMAAIMFLIYFLSDTKGWDNVITNTVTRSLHIIVVIQFVHIAIYVRLQSVRTKYLDKMELYYRIRNITELAFNIFTFTLLFSEFFMFQNPILPPPPANDDLGLSVYVRYSFLQFYFQITDFVLVGALFFIFPTKEVMWLFFRVAAVCQAIGVLCESIDVLSNWVAPFLLVLSWIGSLLSVVFVVVGIIHSQKPLTNNGEY